MKHSKLKLELLSLATKTSIISFILCITLELKDAQGIDNRRCESASCYPETGNLMIGRSHQLKASSTCGLKEVETYCVISQLDFRKSSENSCSWCDSTPEGRLKNASNSHTIDNIIEDEKYSNVFRPNVSNSKILHSSKQTESWWQSKNGVENVSIEVKFESVFQVTHLLIRFKSFLPKAMYIEKSMDWGNSWMICRYFADNCKKSFPHISTKTPVKITDIVCTERYSRITPSTQGVVIYQVIPPSVNSNPELLNPYSMEIQDFLNTTNIRIRMTEMHKLGDEHLISLQRPHLQDKYYYAIYNMVIRGTCVCHGHADKCLPDPALYNPPPLMVHGICDCRHNTGGNNCEHCIQGYNDVPWRPAMGRKKNECKKCDCHGHSNVCVFNSTIYIASGSVSGGVCQNCLHNTTGRQCELCRKGFHQDTNLNLNDPLICKKCNCFAGGTTNNGICDSYTSEKNGLESGRCHCKRFVDGLSCSKCLAGYWNLSESNPYGCSACNCNTLGTLNNDGCTPDTGLCTCKVNVIGQKCNQCKPMYYGLSFDAIGCKSCSCNVGGSYTQECDVLNGQCSCKPFITGRRCHTVKDGYYTGALDYARFEAEMAVGSKLPPTVRYVRELGIKERTNNATLEYNDTIISWTGDGFMKVYEGSTLSFQVPPLYRDMSYDLIIRYEHDQFFPNTWENVQVNVFKHVSDTGTVPVYCSSINNNPWKLFPYNVSLPKDQTYAIMSNSLCLEEDQKYGVNLTFKYYNMSNPDPKSTILIDSIVILPKTQSIHFFYKDETGTELLKKYQDLNCREKFLSAIQPSISDLTISGCLDILYAVSFFSFNGGFNKPCLCDSTGSKSTICDKYTGQCPCIKNIIGRRCNKCPPGKYGLNSLGCKACNCNSLGSFDNFCRQSDGQCRCTKNAYSKQCDKCQPGHWNFPNCKVCMCNGHASTCNDETGKCIKCQDFTTGDHCEKCISGYYGNPLLGSRTNCRACPCPDTKISGHSFADVCHLDDTNSEPFCACKKGYAGARCNRCSDNYFGEPYLPFGSCNLCNCSDNWNVNATGNCHSITGECLKCLHNTEGWNCQYCVAGYWGNALKGTCQQCKCSAMGTNRSESDKCNRFTGKCNCLPNVIGNACDRCIKNHWGLALNKGCIPCDCDFNGSIQLKCNDFNGRCTCKEGFGGSKCNQCKKHYWGNPQIKCKPCHCNPQGSQSFQCDPITGSCVCLEGISGEKCDSCARGFYQNKKLTQNQPVYGRKFYDSETPQCLHCGECFDNWDKILNNLANLTRVQVAEAYMKLEKGAGVGTEANGISDKVFSKISRDLKQLKEIIAINTVPTENVSKLESKLMDIFEDTSNLNKSVHDQQKWFLDMDQNFTKINTNFALLQSRINNQSKYVDSIVDEATELALLHPEGAYNVTKDSWIKSKEAQAMVQKTTLAEGPISNSQNIRASIEMRLNSSEGSFLKTHHQNKKILQKISDTFRNISLKIPLLNYQICGGPNTTVDAPCHNLCGGAGCGFCGGNGCHHGSINKAQSALDTVSKAEQIIMEKRDRAEFTIQQIRPKVRSLQESYNKSMKAFEIASKLYNTTQNEYMNLRNLTDRYNDIQMSLNSTPNEIIQIAQECISLNNHFKIEDYKLIEKEINYLVDTKDFSFVKDILQETREDELRCKKLNESATNIYNSAVAAKEMAVNTMKTVKKADQEHQSIIDFMSLINFQSPIFSKHISKIQSSMDKFAQLSTDTKIDMEDTFSFAVNILSESVVHEQEMNSSLMVLADTEKKLLSINAQIPGASATINDLSDRIEAKINDMETDTDILMDLRERARNLANRTTYINDALADIELEYEKDEELIDEMHLQLVKMNCEMIINLKIIEDKSNFYRVCSITDTWESQTTCVCHPGASEPECVAFNQIPKTGN